MRLPQNLAQSVLVCAILVGCDSGADDATTIAPAATGAAATVPPVTAAGDGPATSSPGGGPVESATALIREMIEVYRNAPVLIDSTTATTVIGGQPGPRSESVLRLGPGRDAEFVTPHFHLAFYDRTAYVTYSDVPDRYLRLEGIDDIYAVGDSLAGSVGRLVQTNLRFARPIDDIVQALALGLTGQARISGYREIVDADGRRLRQISLITPRGSASVNVDPQTKLIRTIESEEEMADAPVPNLTVTRRTLFETEIRETADPIAFDPGDRFVTDSADVLRGVGSADTLRHLKLVPGKPAPDFALYTILGSRFELSKHRGRVVVLAFWASWDVPSRDAITKLSALAPWSEANDIEVEVVGVCGMRRRTAKEGYWDQTLRFWEREEPTFETLIDPDDEVFRQYGVLGVPMTVVLDREGRFVNAVGGFEEGSLEAVARIVSGAAAASGER